MQTVGNQPSIDVYEAGRKSMGVAYLLWFFLGTFGVHRFYLRRRTSAWVQFGIHVGGWLLLALALWHAGQGSVVHVDEPGLYQMTTSWSAVVGGGVLAWLGGVLLAIVWPWWVIDALLIPGMTNDFNRRLQNAIGRA